MKKLRKFLLLTVIIGFSLFLANHIYAVEYSIKDIKYYNQLIEEQKIVTILLEKTTVSRKVTKEEVMKSDKKIEEIKDAKKNTLKNTDLVKTGDYVTVKGEDYQVVLYGDVNKDGSICDIEDIMILQNNYLGQRKVEAIEKLAGNLVNTDNTLDIEDIMRMLNVYLGSSEDEIITKIQEGFIEFDSQDDKQENDNDGTPVSIHGKLSVQNTDIIDKNGNTFQLKGISTHGLQWFPQYVNQEAFIYMREEWGINCVRLAMYTGASEGYTTELHKIVSNGVEYAKNAGMYVIIDWHILNEGNPNTATNKEKAKAFFKEMTTKYKDYDNVLYEICNEPNGDVQWERDIKPYAEEMIREIRANDDDAIIIVGTPTWSQDVDVVARKPNYRTEKHYVHITFLCSNP